MERECRERSRDCHVKQNENIELRRRIFRPTSRLQHSNGTNSNCHSSHSSRPANIPSNGSVLGRGRVRRSWSSRAARGASSPCRSSANSTGASGGDSVRREGVGLVVVGLDVSILQGLVLAFDDRHEVELGVGASQSIREDITDGKVNSLLVQVVTMSMRVMSAFTYLTGSENEGKTHARTMKPVFKVVAVVKIVSKL